MIFFIYLTDFKDKSDLSRWPKYKFGLINLCMVLTARGLYVVNEWWIVPILKGLWPIQCNPNDNYYYCLMDYCKPAEVIAYTE